MKTMMTVLAFVLSLNYAYAGNEGASGGDEIALEFRLAFASVVGRTQGALPSLFQEIEKAKLAEILEGTEVLVVNEPLLIKHDGIYQESIAINKKNPRQIVINRSRWKELEKVEIREALALHEVASLAGLEDTGKYTLSAKYLGLFMLDVDPAFDFSTGCGKIEIALVRRARSLFEVGEGTRTNIEVAEVALQERLRECGILKKAEYCEIVLPKLALIVEALTEEVKYGYRGQYELDVAVGELKMKKEICERKEEY